MSTLWHQVRYEIGGGTLTRAQRAEIEKFLRSRHANVTSVRLVPNDRNPMLTLIIDLLEDHPGPLLTNNVQRAVKEFIPDATITQTAG